MQAERGAILSYYAPCKALACSQRLFYDAAPWVHVHPRNVRAALRTAPLTWLPACAALVPQYLQDDDRGFQAGIRAQLKDFQMMIKQVGVICKHAI